MQVRQGELARNGGVAAYFVQHREVAWVLLVATLVWGWSAFQRLAQQEDPTIPHRHAIVATSFPGAMAAKVESLVTEKLEKKISELPSVEEIHSESRYGMSVISVAQRPAPEGKIDQEWDKLRAKLQEVELPAGCQSPFLNTDFGKTLTLLYAIASPPISDAECEARARIIRASIRDLRSSTSTSESRVSAVALYPPAVALNYRRTLQMEFSTALQAESLGRNVLSTQGRLFDIVDFETGASKEVLDAFLDRFMRRRGGTEGELHPDFTRPFLLFADEDPHASIRQSMLPRYSYRDLEVAAEGLEDELKQLSSVGKVTKIGTVPETIYLLMSTAAASGFQLSPEQVIRSIAERNALIPGGAYLTGGQHYPVRVTGEFGNEEDLLHPVIGLATSASESASAPVYLRDLFEVRRTYEDPISFKVDVLHRQGADGLVRVDRCVLVAVEMRDGERIGPFARDVAGVLGQYRGRLPDGMELVTVSDQPQAVQQRLAHFIRCFLEAVVIVILVALALMDGRSAVVVAAAIPLTVAMTLGGMHLFGIPLHQISVAALIIALGMLVDDPVVASDAINRELYAGVPRERAAWQGPVKLGRAILFGTLINIVAFLPLLLLPGDKGAFIGALPVVVSLALVSSRIVSMTFVPLLAYYILRGQKGLEEGGHERRFLLFRWIDRGVGALLPRYQRWIEAALDRPGLAVVLAYGVLLASCALIPLFGSQFFPPAERNQLLIDLELPAHSSVSQTRRVMDRVVEHLKQQPQIVSAAVFTGGMAPRFYYNVSPKEPASHLAQVLVNTRQAADVPPLLVRLREELDARVTGARCVVRQLEQGPPVEVPIQVRVSGGNLNTLRDLADQVANTLRQAGAYRVHDDLGWPMPALEIDIDQDRANTLGIGNRQIGRLTSVAFSGLRVTEMREGDHLIPVVIRLRMEERNDADKIRAMYVQSGSGGLVPLESIARLGVTTDFATIPHFGLLRSVTVKAYSRFDELPSAVLARARPKLEAMMLPAGYRLEYAGEAKELKASQEEMGLVMKVSLALIAVLLVAQFHSVSKALVVLLTVPLGLIGAFVGIAALQTSQGFMSLLGMVSLAGVIVSHIIVLSDYIEEARREGAPLRVALRQAGLVRLRAVMVTVFATVGGLIPLTLTGGELWRPLTAVHIFGLLLATVLTLLILPAIYFLFSDRLRWIRSSA